MACSKIFSGDLPELTSDIMQYFRNDFSTLHSCILVNRLWCRLAIPLLWEDPFSIADEDFDNYIWGEPIYREYHFVGIYLHYLNDDDKSQLNEIKIDNNIIPSIPSNTLFNYPSFIKCLNILSLFLFTVDIWVENIQPVTSSKQNKDLRKFIILSLIKIFIKSQVKLHTLEIEGSCKFYENPELFNSVFELILQNPSFIRNIRNLKIRFNNLDSCLPFLKYLYPICNSISSLYFKSYNNNDNNILVEKSLSQLINSQQNFRKFFLGTQFPFLNGLMNSNCSNTLNTIIFSYVDFKNLVNFKEVFEQLNVLESIHILYCYSLNANFTQQIISITKPFKLKSLFFNRTHEIELFQFQLLLQKSGNYLENIESIPFANEELKQQSFELIIRYCTNIKFLRLTQYNYHNCLTFDLIKNIGQILNYLTITLSNDSERSSILLLNLGQILPFKLEYLRLSLKIYTRDLEIFLKNSKNTFIEKLLISNEMYEESENILPCIKEYIMKERRVKYLAIYDKLFYNYYSKSSDELFSLKDEVNEFKLYNIQVKKFVDLMIDIEDIIETMY
ncbi:hypothetical protein C1645_805897 [Glomus cerebriforme]|uniref:F-box domain-containing protein n=1 Tax=Glomus cerebriforme TaxID=658196 RepID=A0A397T525_9GLOM|nr:hypothetical protein C1645_805897 [Glomus cerebriforme]